MKQKLSLLFVPILLLSSSFFFACSNTEEEQLKISSIYTQNYGVIKPLDIYLIKDGYITNYSAEKVKATTLAKYFVKYYEESKQTTSTSDCGIYISDLKFDIVNWKYQYKDWEAIYFHKSLQYSYTIHIDLVEKATSYLITYYYISDLKMNIDGVTGYTRELCFDTPPEEELLQYKRIKEFPKSEIISIDYMLIT